jgi:hypothetical protein
MLQSPTQLDTTDLESEVERFLISFMLFKIKHYCKLPQFSYTIFLILFLQNDNFKLERVDLEQCASPFILLIYYHYK